MKRPGGGTDKAVDLDSSVEVPGGLVGTDPFRRWGRILRWTSVVSLAPIYGANWRPFDKRDVVVTDLSGKRELYREGPFPSGGAKRRQEVILRRTQAGSLHRWGVAPGP